MRGKRNVKPLGDLVARPVTAAAAIRAEQQNKRLAVLVAEDTQKDEECRLYNARLEKLYWVMKTGVRA